VVLDALRLDGVDGVVALVRDRLRGGR
jgi:hypothetical protein